MKICIDIQAAVTQTAGVGRYTRRLIEHLGPLAADAGDEVRLFYFDFRKQARPPAVRGAELRPFRTVPGSWIQAAWRMLPVPDFRRLAGAADVYHFPNFVLPPLRKGRSVVTIHDISFLRFPQFAERRNLRNLRGAIPNAVARADAVVTISHFSAAEITGALAVDPARVFVTYPGVDPQFRPIDLPAVNAMRAALQLDRPYLLTVGTLEPRKNHALLVDVFERLEQDFDGILAVAGARGWQTDPILERFRQSRRSGSIRVLEHVPEAWLPALYTGAEALLFPSFYEGFGLPPLEALACGTPVVSSEGGALPEVLDTPAVVRPGVLDAEAWAVAVRDLLAEDADHRRQRSAIGRRHAASYRWETMASRTMEVYRSVLQ